MDKALTISLLSLLPFYVLGAFPTGHLIARSKGIQITSEGSGNVGATNVVRVVGKKAGVLTLLLDMLKGLLAVSIASLVSGESWYTAWAGVAAVAGHCFSIPGKLKGGKGVATSLGVFLYLAPLPAVLGIISFAVIIWVWRIVSLASVMAAFSMPLYALLFNAPDGIALPMAGISLLVIARHYPNLVRLMEGTEKKFAIDRERPRAPQAPQG